MESINWHCCCAYNSVTPSPTYPLSPKPSILPLSSAWLLYIAVSISAQPAGWSCRSRLWEICVDNAIWSPQDLSEWAASVCGRRLDTGLIRGGGGSLCRAGRKVSPDRPRCLIDVTLLCVSIEAGSPAFSGQMWISPRYPSIPNRAFRSNPLVVCYLLYSVDSLKRKTLKCIRYLWRTLRSSSGSYLN